MAQRVLVIEDDEAIASVVTAVLARAGLDPMRRGDGRAGIRALHDQRPGLVVLDIGLPELDGWAVLERIRDISDVPVLLLTARSHRTEVVRGLQAGADDYLTKPFDTGELAARVHALLRRARGPAPAPETIADGPLRIDPATRTLTLDGRSVALTPIEFRLISALVGHAGQVLSATQLLELAWADPTGISPERVKFSVHRLRRKLGWDAGESPIEAVRGFGYRYRRIARA